VRAAVLLALAIAALGGACAEEALPPRFASEANEAILELAKAGDLDAQVALGQALESGRGGAPDYAGALHWYRKAARAGHPLAQYQLGQLYEHGRGVARDYAEAARWYRAAAEGGSDVAGFQLGYLYEKGLGVPRDVKQAVYWYERAAEAWRAKASHPLAPAHVLVGLETSAGAPTPSLPAATIADAVPPEPEPMEESPPIIPAAGGGAFAHLASFRTTAEAGVAWSDLRARHPEDLGPLDPHLAELDLGEGSGVFHQLLAGPLSDAGVAEALCARLNARGQFCQPVAR
jgi:hypothetical protein